MLAGARAQLDHDAVLANLFRSQVAAFRCASPGNSWRISRHSEAVSSSATTPEPFGSSQSISTSVFETKSRVDRLRSPAPRYHQLDPRPQRVNAMGYGRDGSQSVCPLGAFSTTPCEPVILVIRAAKNLRVSGSAYCLPPWHPPIEGASRQKPTNCRMTLELRR